MNFCLSKLIVPSRERSTPANDAVESVDELTSLNTALRRLFSLRRSTDALDSSDDVVPLVSVRLSTLLSAPMRSSNRAAMSSARPSTSSVTLTVTASVERSVTVMSRPGITSSNVLVFDVMTSGLSPDTLIWASLPVVRVVNPEVSRSNSDASTPTDESDPVFFAES